MWFVALALVVPSAIGFTVGRWWSAVAPMAAIVAFYVGLHQGWWGYGVGDAWYVAMLIGIVLAGVGVGCGIALRRRLSR